MESLLVILGTYFIQIFPCGYAKTHFFVLVAMFHLTRLATIIRQLVEFK